MSKKTPQKEKESKIEEIAQKERDETFDEEERKLDTEGNPIHPSLLEKLKEKEHKKHK